MTEENQHDEAFHLAGDRLGKFVILSELGRGSMGVVYEAFQEDLKRKVALKILPANITLDVKQVRRFHREAESVARLRHDNVIQIYEVGEIEGTHYFAMELVDGRPLSGRFGRDKESILRAARIAMQAARGLAHAHEQGVIHRDIKPGNLLLDRNGRVVVTDFGLARLSDSASLTSTDAIVGTPKYMSPEQILPRAHQPVDGRTDIYSLGATLYHITTGRPPFEAPSVQAFIKCILEDRAGTPRKHNKQVPFDLATIILRCLEKDPDDRYRDAGALADDLERFLGGERIHAKPKGTAAIAIETVRRHRIVALLSVVAVIATILGLVFGGQAAESKRQANLESQLRSISESRDYDLAVQQIEALAEQNPGNGKILQARAKVYENRAMRLLEDATPVRTDIVSDLEQAGLANSFWHLMLLVDLEDRRDEARRIAETLPETSSLRMLVLARLALIDQNFELAASLLASEPRGLPPQALIYHALTLGQAYMGIDREGEAATCLQRAALASRDIQQAWLRFQVLQQARSGGVNIADLVAALSGVVGNSMELLSKLGASMTPVEAELANRFVQRVLELARQDPVPSATLLSIAKRKLETAAGRDRALAGLMLFIGHLSQNHPDDASRILDDAGADADAALRPYVYWAWSLVYRQQNDLDASLMASQDAIRFALGLDGFRDLEQLFKNAVLLVKQARNGDGKAEAENMAEVLREQLDAVEGDWVSGLLKELSPPGAD